VGWCYEEGLQLVQVYNKVGKAGNEVEPVHPAGCFAEAGLCAAFAKAVLMGPSTNLQHAQCN
jgi:hypothetical protein